MIKKMIKKLVLAGRMANFRKSAIVVFSALRGLSEYEDGSAEIRARVTLDGEPYELIFKRIQEVRYD